MDFTKMHGAANDFVVVDGRDIKRDWSKMAIAVCNRHLGIGCDSLIILLPSRKADFGMRTFDTDGSEAETCGNGIRCVARYVLEKRLASPEAKEITIETVATVNRVWFEKTGNKVTKFWANMGKPQLTADKIPVTVKPGDPDTTDVNGMISYRAIANGFTLDLDLVSMGNPHAVYFSTVPISL